MNGTVRLLAFTVALLGLTATADAKNDSHHGKNEKHDEHHGAHEPDRHDKHFVTLRGSYAFDDHRFDRHDKHRKPEHDQIKVFHDVWRNTGFYVQSCFKKAWWTIVSHWDHFHGKIRHKPHGGYTPVHHGKPGHHKPDWDWHKPHNHDWPDKPDWHPKGPDCPEEPPVIPVPEPGSLSILASALLTASWLFRRRNRTS